MNKISSNSIELKAGRFSKYPTLSQFHPQGMANSGLELAKILKIKLVTLSVFSGLIELIQSLFHKCSHIQPVRLQKEASLVH